MFERPTLTSLIDRVRADVLSRLPTDDVLRHSDAEVLARVLAGATHGLYGYLDYLSQQLLPDTATDFLDRHGSLFGILRKSAARATGSVTLTTTAGVVIPAGTVLRRADQTLYETVAEQTATGTTLAVDVQAQVAGEAGNASASTPLTLVSPIAGVASSVVAGTLSGGADLEDDEAYRARILARWRQAPHGGSWQDYVAWALEVEGVTRAWCSPEELGPGTVTLRFVRDDDASPIPDAGEVATVAAHIAEVRPVTASVTVVAPVAAPLTFTISGLLPATTAVRAAVESALRALLRRESEPGEPLLISHIREAISTAAGEYDHALVSPSADVTHGTGAMATFGSISWV